MHSRVLTRHNSNCNCMVVANTLAFDKFGWASASRCSNGTLQLSNLQQSMRQQQ